MSPHWMSVTDNVGFKSFKIQTKYTHFGIL